MALPPPHTRRLVTPTHRCLTPSHPPMPHRLPPADASPPPTHRCITTSHTPMPHRLPPADASPPPTHDGTPPTAGYFCLVLYRAEHSLPRRLPNTRVYCGAGGWLQRVDVYRLLHRHGGSSCFCVVVASCASFTGMVGHLALCIDMIVDRQHALATLILTRRLTPTLTLPPNPNL
jgi:hypothetical protein